VRCFVGNSSKQHPQISDHPDYIPNLCDLCDLWIDTGWHGSGSAVYFAHPAER
jgi:hypothetical protein